MLYDPTCKPNTETKPDIFALPTLIAWLEKQPAAEAYDYEDRNGGCLLGQYMTAHGLDWYGHFHGGADRYSYLCRRTDWGYLIACVGPRTFGGALARARELAAHAEGSAE